MVLPVRQRRDLHAAAAQQPDEESAVRAAGHPELQRALPHASLHAIGGRAHLTTVPGEGVEWEFTVPR